MPELPEVETVAADLRPQLIGSRFCRGAHPLAAHTGRTRPRTARRTDRGPAGDRYWSARQVSSGAPRLGADADHPSPHDGTTGRGRGRQPAVERPHLRASFELTDGRRLTFTDARKFGRIWLVDKIEEVVGKLGLEPLDWTFTPKRLPSGCGRGAWRSRRCCWTRRWSPSGQYLCR